MHRRLWWGLVSLVLFSGAWWAWSSAQAATADAPAANPDPDCAVPRFIDDPDPVPGTGTTDLKVLMKNYSSDAGSNVTLHISDDDHAFTHIGYSFDPAGPPGASCTYNDTAYRLECTFPTLPGNASFWVIWTVQAPETPGVYDSTATTSCSPDGQPGNNQETNQTSVIRGVNLDVDKTVASTNVPAGSIVTFDITVTNHGPGDSQTGIVLTDTLDPGLTFVGDDADPAADDDASWDCSASGQDITCTYTGTLASGASSTFHYRARVTTAAPATVSNDAQVTVGNPDEEGDPDTSNNTDSVSLTVDPGTDLQIEKDLLDGSAIVGGRGATFRLVVTNLGPMDTSDVTVTDRFPTGYTIDPADITAPAGWSCSVSDSGGPAPTVTCQSNGTTLANGASVTIDIVATPPEPSSIETHTNEASVTVNDITDGVTGNNTASIEYDVYPNKPDLGVIKSIEPDPVAQGSPITVTLDVFNDGLVDANPFVVRDSLASGESVDPTTLPSGSPWDCTYESSTHDIVCTYTDNGGTFLAGDASTITYQVTASGTGVLEDTACVEVNQPGRPDDYDNSNDCDSASTTSTSEHADLVVEKTVDDTHLTVSEDTLTFTITITNNGPDDSGNVSFDDDVPFYVTAGPGGRPATSINVTSVTGGGTCNVSGAHVYCSWSNIPSGTTVTVTYTVSRPMEDGTSIVNDVCVYSSDVGDPNRDNNCDSAPAVQVDPVTDVELVSKTVSDNPATAGTEITYTFKVRNNGPSVAQNVQLSDTFTPTPSTATLTLISVTATHGGSCTWAAPDLTCTWATLDPGETATVEFTVRPDHIEPPPDPWNFVNNASVTTDTTESNGDNNGPISITTNVQAAQLDIILEKNESPDFSEPVQYDPSSSNNLLVYELALYNRGPSVATQIHIEDRVNKVTPLQTPNQQLQFLYDTANSDGTDDSVDWCTPPSPNPFSVNDTIDTAEPLIRCDAPSGFVLEPGQTIKRYLVFRVLNEPNPTSGDVYTNEAKVTVYETPQETYTANNEEDESTTVRTVVDLWVQKTSPSPVEIYTSFNMTITVGNDGPGVAVDTTVSDDLPAGMELTGTPSPDQGSCTGTAGDTSFTCDLGDLNDGDTVTITVPVRVTDPNTTTYTNTVTVDTVAPDTDTTNNTATVDVQMNPPVRLGDLVWYDQNQDGIQDSDEPGLNGVTVTLYDNANCTGSPYDPGVAGFSNPVTTGDGSWADGYYEFYPLPHDTYCLKFEVPTTVLDNPILSPQDQGSDDTADSDATEVSTGVYTITNIDLNNTSLTSDLTNDVGVYEEGSIGDRVWCESPQNVNDTYDPADGDTGTNDITVKLYADFDCDGTPDSTTPLQTTTTTTGGSPSDPGFYEFTGLQVALAGSSNQTCYVVEVDTNDPDLGDCRLPDTPDDGTWDATEKTSLDLDTDNPDVTDVDFSFRKGDFGDLPESGSGTFPTTRGNNGPYHLLDEDLYLGACADAETDAAADDPDAGMVAGGDDGTVSTDRVGTCGTGGDDEDGIKFVTPLIPGQRACILVTAHNATGHAINLYGWADWDGSGTFSSTEQLSGGDFVSGVVSIPDGGVSDRKYCFDVPSTASFRNGDIHFRFRLTTESLSSAAFDGPASNGEVEDYWLPLACVGNTLWDDGQPPVNSVQDASESGLNGIPVRLVYAGDDDAIDTGADNTTAQDDDVIVASTTTDANGQYMFCGIAPPSESGEEYVFQIQVPPHAGLKSVAKDAGTDDALDSDAAPGNSLASGWVDDTFTVAPAFTSAGAPAYLTIDGSAPPTGEAGLGDSDSEANDDGYPDARTDWTHDFGFIVYKDYGDLPNSGAGNFNTTKADSGPWHWVTEDLYLGACVDVETDGQPDDADAGVLGGGDDGNAGFDTIGTCATPGDDEDGIQLVTPLIPGAEACIKVTAHNATGKTAYLYAWFDWDGSGTFESGERLNTGDFSSGAYSFTGDLTDEELCFTVPGDASFTGGEIHMRFRLTTDSTLSSPDGGATDGEVEDYWTPTVCVGSLVWEDRDLGGDQDAGEPPFAGMTVRLVYGGEDGTVSTGVNDTTAATGERLYTTTTDANGLYSFCGLIPSVNGMTYQVQISSDGSGLYATDADATGVPDDQDSDATPEHTVDNGWAAPAFTLTLDDTQPGDVAKDGGAMPTGEAGIGDSTVDAADHSTPDARDDWTQDFGFQLYYDYGDLPESGNGSFATTQNNDGPYHRVTPDLMLGDCVDTETDGQPGPRAGVGGSTGDDSSTGFATEGTCATAGNDEDGLLSSITPAAPGERACFQIKVTNTTGSTARLYAWIDWDGDGQFQNDEQLMGEDFGTVGYADIEDGLTGATKTLCFTMPAASVLGFDGGEVHARLRLTTEDLSARTGGYALWEGPAADGEVEDYWAPLACVGNYVWLDNGSTANEQDADDEPLSGVDVRLVWAGSNGNIETDPDDADAQGDDVIFATTTTDANGRYMFCGLPAGAGSAYTYQVQVLPMPGYYSVAKDAGTDDTVDSDAGPANSLANGWAADTFGLQVDYTSAPGYILKDGSALPTGEGGNEDANSEANDNNFPDARTDWTQDFGFVKYEDYGDLPASFEGTEPAVHPLRPDLYLGACVDAESTNAADAEAGMDGSGGDDNTAGTYTVGTCATAGDDEDGVELTTPLVPGAEACVKVTAHNATGGTAYLYAWFDWDGSGTFESGEQLDTGDFSGGVYSFTGNLSDTELCFTVPSDASFDGGEVHYRFRLTTQADLAGPTGAATDGEVEDYWTRLACVGNLVWNDSTGTVQDVQDTGDSAVSGLTVRLVWGGADNAIDTQASDTSAQDDDRVYTTTTDSNGVYDFCGLTEGTYQIQIPNPPSSLPQAVRPDQGTSDYKDSDGSQPANGDPVTGPTFTLTDLTALPTSEDGLRDTGSSGYANNFPDNQVDESYDFGFRPVPVDFGDLPDTYSTSGAGGASHTISPNLYLGSCVDAEIDGQPSTNADGDDTALGYFTAGTCATAGDDEDGVKLVTPLVPGAEACIQVTAHNATGRDAYLYAWFDWNDDGDFDDTDEMVNTGDFATSSRVTIPDGGVTDETYCFDVPATATFNGGEVHMRFRLTTATLSSYAGGASDGEVEDYVEPLYCVGNFVWNDGGSTTVAVQDGTEPGLSGVPVTLHWDGNDDGDFADAVDRTYTTTTDASGYYTFCGLRADATNDGNADAYRVDVTPPAGFTPVAQDQGGNEALDSDGDASGQGPIFTLPPSPDVDTATNDTDPNFYPDARTHLAIDFGFVAYDFGDLPSPYATTLADNGPQHTILPASNPTLGNRVDAERDGQPDPGALGDDNNGTDDEDGVHLPGTFIAGHTYTITCSATNVNSNTVVSAWIDWNGDGDFNDAGEQILNNEAASPSCPSATVTVPLGVASQVAVRYRVANETIPGPNGAVGSGEVEDYRVPGRVVYDYGDLPDSYATTEAAGGPKHQLDANLYLGLCVDSDDDGQPDAQAGTTGAGGDDAADASDTADIEVGSCTAGDDEDGVELTTPLLPGAQACVRVTAHNTTGGDAYLYAWIDWDGSGAFESGELVNTGDFSSGYAVVPNGGVTDQTYCFNVPDSATFEGGQVAMRFRLTTDSLTASDWGGVANDGEVEDYWEPVACIGNFVWNDTASAVVNAQDDSDAPIEDLALYLVWAGPNGTFDTDPGSTTAAGDDVLVRTTTDADGRYTFCGLTGSSSPYRIQVPDLPAGLNQVVTPDATTDTQDSDAQQPGGPTTPVVSPDITLNRDDLVNNALPTGEDGQQDAATQADPTLTHNYPDGRTDLTVDFGFRQVNGAATKLLVATDQDFTTGTDVAIGEIVTYETSLTLSPGTVLNLTLTDVLDRGLAFVACDSITVTGSVTASAGTWDDICANPTVQPEPTTSTDPVDQGRRVTWTFGTVTNSGTSDAVITVRYRAVVLDVADNVDGRTLANHATWTWDAGSADAAADPVEIVEPDLLLEKEADPTIAGPDEPIKFTLTATHAPGSRANAYDVKLHDELPEGLEYIDGTLRAVSGPTPASMTYDPATRTIEIVWDELPLGTTAVVEFQANLRVPDGVVVTNEAWLGWTSLPCDNCYPGDPGYTPSSPYNDAAHERAYDPPDSGYVRKVSVDVYWVLPETGFAPGRVTELPAMPQGFQYADLGDLWLEIPRLGVKVPVVGVPRTPDGWDLTWLGNKAGLLEGIGFPGWVGNAIITAHVITADGLPGPFAGLDRLQWGDRILVHYQGVVYEFEVRERYYTNPYSTQVLEVPQEGYPWLTLVTCATYDEQQDTYLHRIVVQAVLIGRYSE